MPSVRCPCNAWISISNIPCEHEYVFMSDKDFDTFRGTVEVDAVYRAMNSFLKCPECDGLLVYWDGYTGKATYYKPDLSNQNAESAK